MTCVSNRLIIQQVSMQKSSISLFNPCSTQTSSYLTILRLKSQPVSLPSVNFIGSSSSSFISWRVFMENGKELHNCTRITDMALLLISLLRRHWSCLDTSAVFNRRMHWLWHLQTTWTPNLTHQTERNGWKAIFRWPESQFKRHNDHERIGANIMAVSILTGGEEEE